MIEDAGVNDVISDERDMKLPQNKPKGVEK
jgi:hypothetical protein